MAGRFTPSGRAPRWFRRNQVDELHDREARRKARLAMYGRHLAEAVLAATVAVVVLYAADLSKARLLGGNHLFLTDFRSFAAWWNTVFLAMLGWLWRKRRRASADR